MSGDIELERIRKITSNVGEVVTTAIAQYEVWTRCADKQDILERVNNRESFLAPAFNVLRDALHKNLVLMITSLFDKNPKAASLRNVLSILTPELADEFGRQNNVPEPKELLERISVKVSNIVESSEYKALLVLRDTVIAHNDAQKPAHNAKYGDDRKVLEAAIECATDLLLLTQGTKAAYPIWKTRYEEEADKFWGHLARSSPSGHAKS